MTEAELELSVSVNEIEWVNTIDKVVGLERRVHDLEKRLNAVITRLNEAEDRAALLDRYKGKNDESEGDEC